MTMTQKIQFLVVTAFINLVTIAAGDTQDFQVTLPVTDVPTGFTVELPRFDPELGELKMVRFEHINVFAGSAASTAFGGTFVPPNFIAGWAYGETVEFELSGPGFNLPVSRFITRGGSSSSPDGIHMVEFAVGPETLNSAVAVVDPNNPMFGAYIGTGNVPLDFNTNLIPDAGTGGDGFVWSGQDIAEISSASAYASQSQLLISYEFNPMPKFLLGDVNCDGAVNLLDVAPFIELLDTGGFSEKADINGDGSLNLLDVDPFLNLLAGN